ncbi:hypothetical protein NEOKW01_1093 [Nematocida sp. AWRm80]|nr:hypothetical protein NEOKW01_1093 [Nematocida sp. AWRm80]
MPRTMNLQKIITAILILIGSSLLYLHVFEKHAVAEDTDADTSLNHSTNSSNTIVPHSSYKKPLQETDDTNKNIALPQITDNTANKDIIDNPPATTGKVNTSKRHITIEDTNSILDQDHLLNNLKRIRKDTSNQRYTHREYLVNLLKNKYGTINNMPALLSELLGWHEHSSLSLAINCLNHIQKINQYIYSQPTILRKIDPIYGDQVYLNIPHLNRLTKEIQEYKPYLQPEISNIAHLKAMKYQLSLDLAAQKTKLASIAKETKTVNSQTENTKEMFREIDKLKNILNFTLYTQQNKYNNTLKIIQYTEQTCLDTNNQLLKQIRQIKEQKETELKSLKEETSENDKSIENHNQTILQLNSTLAKATKDLNNQILEANNSTLAAVNRNIRRLKNLCTTLHSSIHQNTFTMTLLYTIDLLYPFPGIETTTQKKSKQPQKTQKQSKSTSSKLAKDKEIQKSIITDKESLNDTKDILSEAIDMYSDIMSNYITKEEIISLYHNATYGNDSNDKSNLCNLISTVVNTLSNDTKAINKLAEYKQGPEMTKLAQIEASIDKYDEIDKEDEKLDREIDKDLKAIENMNSRLNVLLHNATYALNQYHASIKAVYTQNKNMKNNLAQLTNALKNDYATKEPETERIQKYLELYERIEQKQARLINTLKAYKPPNNTLSTNTSLTETSSNDLDTTDTPLNTLSLDDTNTTATTNINTTTARPVPKVTMPQIDNATLSTEELISLRTHLNKRQYNKSMMHLNTLLEQRTTLIQVLIEFITNWDTINNPFITRTAQSNNNTCIPSNTTSEQDQADRNNLNTTIQQNTYGISSLDSEETSTINPPDEDITYTTEKYFQLENDDIQNILNKTERFKTILFTFIEQYLKKINDLFSLTPLDKHPVNATQTTKTNDSLIFIPGSNTTLNRTTTTKPYTNRTRILDRPITILKTISGEDESETSTIIDTTSDTTTIIDVTDTTIADVIDTTITTESTTTTSIPTIIITDTTTIDTITTTTIDTTTTDTTTETTITTETNLPDSINKTSENSINPSIETRLANESTIDTTTNPITNTTDSLLDNSTIDSNKSNTSLAINSSIPITPTDSLNSTSTLNKDTALNASDTSNPLPDTTVSNSYPHNDTNPLDSNHTSDYVLSFFQEPFTHNIPFIQDFYASHNITEDTSP